MSYSPKKALTLKQELEVLKMDMDGFKYGDIAKRYKVSKGTVCNIVSRHVDKMINDHRQQLRASRAESPFVKMKIDALMGKIEHIPYEDIKKIAAQY